MSSSSNERLQMLLDQKAQLEARINAEIHADYASRQTSNVQRSPSSRGHQSGHRRRRQDVPRSFSHSGSISRTLSSSGHGQHDSIPMSATISQRSAPSMARHGSKGSNSSIPSMPFSNVTGHITPLFQDRRHNPVLESYMSHQDDPVNDYTFHRSASQRQPLEQLPELDYGEHPENYFARTGLGPTVSVTPSPIEAPTTGQWQNPHRLSVSSRRQSFGIHTPPTLTIATTASEMSMSRANSYCSDGINGPFRMMNVNSNDSFYGSSFDDTTSYQSVHIPPSQSKCRSSEEQTLLVTGVGGESHNSFQISHSPGSTSQVLSPFEDMKRSQSSDSWDMKRSESNESSLTTSSSKSSRAVERLQLQNQIARTRSIAPKTESDEESWKGSTEVLKSKTSTAEPIAISKAPYQRPKHERVYCSQCQENPEGFRGAHELGRHVDRQHKVFVKKYVCVQPADGLSHVQPMIPLSKCKACSKGGSSKGGKKYGAYYNAAAHLRRAHFKPKARGRSKSKPEEKLEKRGGKGGGHWPSMQELKPWLQEVSVHVTENQQANDGDDCDDECDVNNYDDEDYNSMSNVSAVDGGFSFADPIDTSMIDSFQQLPIYNTNTQSMSHMQFDSSLLSQQPIDSMVLAQTSGQTQFDSSFNQVLVNDPLQMGSFTNDQLHFPQTFGPSTATDLLSYQPYTHVM